MATPEVLTVRRLRGDEGTSLSQDQFNQMLAAAIEANPIAVIRTIEGLMVAPENPVENQVLFIDSELTPDNNGVYGFKDGRNWKRIGDVQL